MITQSGRTYRTTWLHRLIPIILYLILACMIMGKVLLHPLYLSIGSTGDPQQFMWYLGWFWHATLHGWNPFHLRLLDAPVGQNAMWNTSILTESFLFGPLAWITNVTFVYNFLWGFNFVLSCWISERILRRLSVRPWLSVCGGLLMGLTPYFTAQTLFHIHLWMTCIVLGMVYMVIRGYQTGPRHPVRFGVGLGLLAVLEFYTSVEVCATLALISFVVLILGLLFSPRQLISNINKPRIAAVCVAGLVLIVLAIPGIYEMFHGASKPHGALLPANSYVNDFLNFFVPTRLYWLHTHASDVLSHKYTGNYWENNGYLGPAAILLFLFSAVTLWRYRLARVAIVSFVCIAVLSMGPFLHLGGHITHIPLPWTVVTHLPFMNSALPSRIMFYGDILLVMLFTFAVEHQFRAGTVKWFRPISFGLLLMTFVTWLPPIPYEHIATPSATRALHQGSPVERSLAQTTTYVLSTATPDVMQPIALTGYPFGMANEYGYAGYLPGRHAALVDMALVLKPGLSQAQLENILKMNLPKLQVQRLLYFPLIPGNHLTDTQYAAINNVLGNPIAQDSGAIVWNVSLK